MQQDEHNEVVGHVNAVVGTLLPLVRMGPIESGRQPVYTIVEADLAHPQYVEIDLAGGKIWVQPFMGHIQPCDVGKRIYRIDGVYQVENQAQLEARISS